jgi:hypothetical protein
LLFSSFFSSRRYLGQAPVFDLADSDCGSEVLISVIEGARV